MEAAN